MVWKGQAEGNDAGMKFKWGKGRVECVSQECVLVHCWSTLWHSGDEDVYEIGKG